MGVVLGSAMFLSFLEQARADEPDNEKTGDGIGYFQTKAPLTKMVKRESGFSAHPQDQVNPSETKTEEPTASGKGIVHVDSSQLDLLRQTSESVEKAIPADILEGDTAPMSLPGGFSGKSGVTPQSVALPNGSGSIQGMGESFTPNLNTGSGSFSVPIAVPPGRRGLQPSLGLSYSAGAGNSTLGWGWAMGAPFISRQTDKGIPWYTKADRFIYNGGSELVPVKMPKEGKWREDWPSDDWNPEKSGEDITYYRARVEGNFMRFFYNRDRDTWLVQDRQGNHYYYGAGESSRIYGPKGTYQWNLSRQEDVRRALNRGGNDIHYVYLYDGGQLYLQDIFWNSYGQEYGVLDKYQHNAHFVYESRPDPSVSFATGFRLEQNLRLNRVEVSSYDVAPAKKRGLTRVYLFSYKSEYESFHSRLTQVQVCGSNWQVSTGGTCMPPLEFSYSEIAGVSTDGEKQPERIYGFGYFNEYVRQLSTSPDVSADDEDVDLMDVNQDGLPDLLITKPEYFGKEHAAILNDGLGNLDPEKAKEITHSSGWSLRLGNLNVSVLDVDGAGNADLLHMPYAQKYAYYRLSGDEKSGFSWVATDNIPLNPHIDFTKDAQDIRLVDINNDHLVDIVRTTGQRMQHFVNLSAFPQHNGQFGRIDENGEPIPNESIDTCVLMRGGMMQFHKGNLHFGDMNGDGLQDLVDLKSGSIGYWPNRGYGQWGDSEVDCKAGEYIDNTDIEMENSPWFANPENEGVTVADVNGDGLSDLVQVGFNTLSIWLNRGDNSFAERHILRNTPVTQSGFHGKVRFADINGSGTVDIVWTDAGNYEYIDLAGDYRELGGNGGLPAGLLERVENGLGSTTTIEYRTTTELMVDARGTEDEWNTRVPVPITVVHKVTTTDNLDRIGGTRGEYIAEYVYKDPFYDPHEAEFKGFGYAESWDRERDADGDGEMDSHLCSPESILKGEAPMVNRNWFHRGVRPQCMEPAIRADWGRDSPACAEEQHRDNPFLGLTGASLKTELYSPCTGKVVSATVNEIEVRKLFESSDPEHDKRSVYAIIPNQGKTYKYDPNQELTGLAKVEPYEWVSLKDASKRDGSNTTVMSIPQKEYTPASPDDTFHRISGHTVTDFHGYPTKAYYGGFHRYSGADLYKYANCDQFTEFFTVSFDPKTWVHKATDSHKIGATSEAPGGNCESTCTEEDPCSAVHKEYNEFGDVSSVNVNYSDYNSTEQKSFVATIKNYNAFGQITHTHSGCQNSSDTQSCMRHSENIYQSPDDGDTHYSAFIRKEVAHVPDAKITAFTFEAKWDAGLGQVTKMVSQSGAVSEVMFDELGRVVESRAWNPDFETEESGACAGAGPVTTKVVTYVYGTKESPMSLLKTRINTSQSICGQDRWEYLYTWVDSMGRPYASVAKGDQHLGAESVFPWLVSGTSELNKKGVAVRSCEPLPIDRNPSTARALLQTQSAFQSSLSGAMPGGKWLCSRQEYDAYGRPTTSYSPYVDVAGNPTESMSRAVYRLDEGDSLDHLDMIGVDRNGVNHAGTYTTERVDGLGRVVEKIARHREGPTGDISERITTIKYAGKRTVTSVREDGSVLSRRDLSDSMGRVRVKLGLDFGRWEYRYDMIGQLVQAVNPKGDIADYYYDRAGRLLSEYYNGELEAQYFYDRFDGEVEAALGLDEPGAFPSWQGYPSYGNATAIGSLVAVKDRSGFSISAANFGTHSESWRQIAPSDRLYHAESRVNGAGELIEAIDPDGDKSLADYYSDGTFKSSYWETAAGVRHRIVKEVRANFRGQTELTRFQDLPENNPSAVETVAWTGYNAITGQAMSTVVQQLNRQTEPGGEPHPETLIAYGYEYDEVGKLVAISDWRGRGAQESPRLGIHATHPAMHSGMTIGSHYPSLPGFVDGSLAGPQKWNTGDLALGITASGWPVGVAPSDAKFGYDTLYQLIEEDREYITAQSGGGADFQLDDDHQIVQERVRHLDWKFDARGSMVEWLDGVDSSGNTATQNLGRALGYIKNGYQLNLEAGETGENGCMNHLATQDNIPADCYKPDALYFATNIGPEVQEAELAEGQGTCVWVYYDVAGQMEKQVIRTGCSACEYVPSAPDKGAYGADCLGFEEQGEPGAAGYQRRVEPQYIEYLYSWNAQGQLAGAQKILRNPVNPTAPRAPEVTMAYVYDASGNRVIRQKSETSSDPGNIKQDLYIGGYERRQVQLVSLDTGLPTSVMAAEFATARGRYEDVEGTRLVKYSSGLRIQKDWEDSGFGAEKLFLSFNNHLGSTSAIVDYETGDLVEWRTHYAYGADESHWKNDDPQYDNAEEPYGFTGKEEDEAVGLHYFGARYYSSYLGRWLSPDPPVVHGGGFSNHYNYGANSPYIAIDPDGQWVEYVVGAIVGFVVGFVRESISRGLEGNAYSWADFGNACLRGVRDAAIAVAAVFNPLLGAAVTAADVQVDMLAAGVYPNQKEYGVNALTAFVGGVISARAGAGIGAGAGAISSAIGGAAGAVVKEVFRAAASYTLSVGIALASQSVSGEGLNSENWEQALARSSLNFAMSYGASFVGGELASLGGDPKKAENGSSQSSEQSSSGSSIPAHLRGVLGGGGLVVGEGLESNVGDSKYRGLYAFNDTDKNQPPGQESWQVGKVICPGCSTEAPTTPTFDGPPPLFETLEKPAVFLAGAIDGFLCGGTRNLRTLFWGDSDPVPYNSLEYTLGTAGGVAASFAFGAYSLHSVRLVAGLSPVRYYFMSGSLGWTTKVTLSTFGSAYSVGNGIWGLATGETPDLKLGAPGLLGFIPF